MVLEQDENPHVQPSTLLQSRLLYSVCPDPLGLAKPMTAEALFWETPRAAGTAALVCFNLYWEGSEQNHE